MLNNESKVIYVSYYEFIHSEVDTLPLQFNKVFHSTPYGFTPHRKESISDRFIPFANLYELFVKVKNNHSDVEIVIFNPPAKMTDSAGIKQVMTTIISDELIAPLERHYGHKIVCLFVGFEL